MTWAEKNSGFAVSSRSTPTMSGRHAFHVKALKAAESPSASYQRNNSLIEGSFNVQFET